SRAVHRQPRRPFGPDRSRRRFRRGDSSRFPPAPVLAPPRTQYRSSGLRLTSERVHRALRLWGRPVLQPVLHAGELLAQRELLLADACRLTSLFPGPSGLKVKAEPFEFHSGAPGFTERGDGDRRQRSVLLLIRVDDGEIPPGFFAPMVREPPRRHADPG